MMSRMWSLKRFSVITATVVAVGGLAVPIGSAGANAPEQAKAKCPLNALKNADKPVEITFWHGLNRASEETLQRLTDQFNSSQPDVRVALVNQTTYRDTFTKYVAGLSTGDLPDLVQIQDISLQQMIDTGSVLPAATCVKADKLDLSDHLERVIDYYTVEGTLWPMPMNVSNPVLYYDKVAFRDAGLDPEKPPTNLDELRSASEQLKSSGAVSEAGFGLKTDPWYLEQWLAKGGKAFVNNGNGRDARATKAAFQNSTGLEIFTFMSEMVADGLAIVNADEGGSSVDNLLGIRSGTHAMTIDSSAALGTIAQVFAAGEAGDVELGVAPMPGPKGKGGVLVGGAAMYVVNKSSPEKQAAAWEFAKFFNQADIQAEWAAGTGYVPITESSVELPVIADLWAQEPGFKVAYDQLVTGVNNTATAGPVIGDYQGVRDVLRDAENSMFAEGVKAKAALKAALQAANEKIQSYNSRVGA
jgi:sn-glycerol 3-phosphate transport system substrate-binding protein